MPTLVAAMTLAALLRLSYLEIPRWHLAFWFGAVVGWALHAQGLAFSQALLNGFASFLAAWGYFELLDRTDNRQDAVLHWLLLVAGLFLLIGSRLMLDVSLYQIGL